jgi:Rrf2 family protein
MIVLGTKVRYATRMMIFLSVRGDNGVVKRQEIAQNEDISVDYVEQLLIKLKAAGFVRSHRGAKGGYSLARDPATITVADIIQAMEGRIDLVPCLDEDCPKAEECVTRPVWKEAAEAMMKVFRNVTIAELAARARKAGEGRKLSFSI